MSSKLVRPIAAVKPPPPRQQHTRGQSFDTKEAPPSYHSNQSGSAQHYASIPSRAQILSVLNAMQQTPSLAVIQTVQREKFDPLHDFKKGEIKRGRARVKGSGMRFRDLLCLSIISLLLLALFAVYPALRYYLQLAADLRASARLIGPEGYRTVPDFATNRMQLIDPDTPRNVRARTGYDGQPYELVFSDEFNIPGRTFNPGDDPFWEAFDGWNAGTQDLQWYDRDQIQTANGSLVITIDKAPPGYPHNLSYISGQLTSWNKLCFTGGYIEVSVSMPGSNKGQGFWPAIWLLGNLGRAGYGSTLDGTWPYSYDACDIGTLQRQTPPGKQPVVPNALSGQRLSRCTCPGSDHPGPRRSDGTYVGRAAPEIDVVEGYVDSKGGAFSNALPMAPMDYNEAYVQNSDTMSIYKSQFNTQSNGLGGTLQAEYAVTRSQMAQQIWGQAYGTWGVEWLPSFFEGDGSVTWSHMEQPLWKITDGAFPADSQTFVSARQISMEASHIIMNIAMSLSWHTVDLDSLTFPSSMRIDYVRVVRYPDSSKYLSADGSQYQRSDSIDVTCDPPRAPTAAFIQEHLDAYSQPQLLTWQQTSGGKGTWPRNSLVDQC